jgi:Protein of unknown function (DUF2905)
MPIDSLGKMLLVLGLIVAVFGLLLMLGGRLPFIGNLPGDIAIERDNSRIYIPIATSILLSIVVTVVRNLVFGLFNRS